MALVDNFSGRILFDLSKSDLCHKFHHNHPVASKKCLKANLLSLENVAKNLEPKLLRCGNGCMESLIPIVVDNVPVATIFAGIMDFKDPDLEFFRNNAKKYGFEEHEYIEEVKKIPVIDKNFFIKHLEILNKFADFITIFFYQNCTLKEKELELKREKKFLDDIFNAISDGISVLDSDLNIIKANRALENLHSDKMPFKGKQCFDVYQNRTSPCTMCPVKMSILKKTKRHGIKSAINAKGEKIWFDLHAYPILDEQNEITAVIEFVRDITQQKKAEDLLREERRLFLNGPVVVFKWKAEPGWPVMYVSKNVSQFGYEKNYFEKGNILFAEIIHPEDLERISREILEFSKNTNSFFEQEYRILTKSNEIRWVYDFTMPFRDAEGKTTAYHGYLIDITEKKENENALKISEERLKYAIWGIDDGLWDWNIQTGDVYFSQRWKEMLGYDENDIEPNISSWEKLVHPEDMDRVIRVLNDHLAGKTTIYETEYRMKTKTGEWKWILDKGKVVEWNAEGKPLRAVGTHRDITEKKEMEQSLIRSQHHLKTVLDFTSNWEYWIDSKSEILYISPSCERISGYKPEEIIIDPQLIEKIIYPEDFHTIKHHIGNDFFSMEIHECDFRIVKKNGEVRWISHSCQPVYDENGNFMGRRVSNADITELKETQGALKNAGFELKKKVQEKTEELKNVYRQLTHSEKLSAIGRLSASIAHEFNNPLFGVMNVLAEIKSNEALGDDEKNLASLAINECMRMKNLIRNLQDFNRPSSGEKKFCDIIKLIESVLLFCRKDLSNKKITLKKNFHNPLPVVDCVTDQIKQVLLNIIYNAADACEVKDGGAITIQAEHIGSAVLLTIEDNGTGISKENLDKIFEPFFSTKPEVKGTGLGLSVSYGIIKAHGWDIEVESQEGIGSKFIIKIPVKS